MEPQMLARAGVVLYFLTIISGAYAVMIAALAMIFGDDPDRIFEYGPVAALGAVIILIGWACRKALARWRVTKPQESARRARSRRARRH
jgi:MFS superfamily sulfate permease-like transporter